MHGGEEALLSTLNEGNARVHEHLVHLDHSLGGNAEVLGDCDEGVVEFRFQLENL